MNKFAAYGLSEGDFFSMQHETFAFFAGSIQRVTCDWNTKTAKFYWTAGSKAELVGAAGERREFDAGKLSRTVTSTPLSDRGVYLLYTNLSPLGDSEFAVYFVVNLMWTVIWIQAEWKFGSSFRFSV